MLEENKDKTFLAHGSSYTFLSKTRDSDVHTCHNLNLLVPIIVKNCLPFNIDVTVPGSRQTYFIIKGEESYFMSHDLVESFVMQLKIDGFKFTRVVVDPQTKETEKKVKIKDIDGLTLTLFININRDRAGLELLLYSKVSIINYTGLNLDLYTSFRGFKTRVAGQKVVGRSVHM